MKKANMLVSVMSKNDVIATSAIDHTKYDHYKVYNVDVAGTNYEKGDIYKWDSNQSKFKYFGDTFTEADSINIPNAEVLSYYIKVNGTWRKCEENHQIGY